MDLDLDRIINNVGVAQARRSASSSAQSASQQLKQWWIAERSAPVLLEYQEQLLSTIMEEVRSLIMYIEQTSMLLLEGPDTDVSAGGDVKVRLLVVETELERAKFIARAYKRTRLAKIDAHPYYYFGIQHDESGLMSKDEWIYCNRHLDILAEHYHHSFLGALPAPLQSLTDSSGDVSMVEQPDEHKPVVVRVTREVPTAITVGSEQVLLEKGGVYLLRYSALADVLDSVELI